MSVQGLTLSTQVGALSYDTTANAGGARVQQSADTSSTGNVAKAVEANATDKRSVNSEELKKATENINKVVNLYASELKFTVDDSTGIDVVRVINTDTKEVIRQIPSEEMIKIAESIDRLKGLLVRQQA